MFTEERTKTFTSPQTLSLKMQVIPLVTCVYGSCQSKLHAFPGALFSELLMPSSVCDPERNPSLKKGSASQFHLSQCALGALCMLHSGKGEQDSQRQGRRLAVVMALFMKSTL